MPQIFYGTGLASRQHGKIGFVHLAQMVKLTTVDDRSNKAGEFGRMQQSLVFGQYINREIVCPSRANVEDTSLIMSSPGVFWSSCGQGGTLCLLFENHVPVVLTTYC